MPDSEKWTVIRIYLQAEDYEKLETICRFVEMKPTETLSKIAHAGILALEENRNRMPLPLRFKVDTTPNGAKS